MGLNWTFLFVGVRFYQMRPQIGTPYKAGQFSAWHKSANYFEPVAEQLICMNLIAFKYISVPRAQTFQRA